MEHLDFGFPSLGAQLGPESLESLRSRARILSGSDGQFLHEEGQTNPALCLVHSGMVNLVRRRRDGQVASAGFFGPGHHYGDNSILANRPRTHQAIAVGDAVVWEVDQQRFQEIAATDLNLVFALYRITSARLKIAIGLLDDMRRLRTTERLAKLLAIFARNSPDSPVIVCRQESLAQLMGVSILTLTRSLRHLADIDLLTTGYRHIQVKDITRLEEWIVKRVALED